MWFTFSNCDHFPWKFTWEYFEICKLTFTREDLHLLLSIALEYYLPGITLRWTFLLRCSQTQSTLILMINLCEFQFMVTNSQGFCCCLICVRPRLRPGNFFFSVSFPWFIFIHPSAETVVHGFPFQSCILSCNPNYNNALNFYIQNKR